MIVRGIALGCPLSPLFGAWFLRELDIALVQHNVFYRRFMDDWIVLAKTRNHLRKAIKTSKQLLSWLKLKEHPDRTFIGWIKKGFDFLGYVFTTEGLQISVKCKERCRVKIIRLYEHGANLSRIGLYWRNWVKWARCGLVDSSRTRGIIEANRLDRAQYVKDQLINMVDFDITTFKSELVRYFKLIHFLKRIMETYYEKQQTKNYHSSY